jgi:hypothetical protein
MTIDNELIDYLLKDYKKPEDIMGRERAAEANNETVAGAGDGGGADRARRLREARRGRAQERQLTQWQVGEDAQGQLWHDADRTWCPPRGSQYVIVSTDWSLARSWSLQFPLHSNETPNSLCK